MWTKTYPIILIGYLVSAKSWSATVRNVLTSRIIFRRDTKNQCQFTIFIIIYFEQLKFKINVSVVAKWQKMSDQIR